MLDALAESRGVHPSTLRLSWHGQQLPRSPQYQSKLTQTYATKGTVLKGSVTPLDLEMGDTEEIDVFLEATGGGAEDDDEEDAPAGGGASASPEKKPAAKEEKILIHVSARSHTHAFPQY